MAYGYCSVKATLCYVEEGETGREWQQHSLRKLHWDSICVCQLLSVCVETVRVFTMIFTLQRAPSWGVQNAPPVMIEGSQPCAKYHILQNFTRNALMLTRYLYVLENKKKAVQKPDHNFSGFEPFCHYHWLLVTCDNSVPSLTLSVLTINVRVHLPLNDLSNVSSNMECSRGTGIYSYFQIVTGWHPFWWGLSSYRIDISCVCYYMLVL